MNGYDVLPIKFDLEAGLQNPTLPRVQRIASTTGRTRRLILVTSVGLLAIILLVIGLPFLEKHNLYGFEFPRLSFRPSTITSPPLPRHRDYIVFESPSHSTRPSLAERPLKPASRLPKHCLESYFALGHPCSDKKDTRFDIVWTWVNGSDKHFQEAIADATMKIHPETGEAGNKSLSARPTSKLYRDHDELRHSFRSVLKHFRSYTKQFRLVTSDFPFSADDLTMASTTENYNVTSEGTNFGKDGKDSLNITELTQDRMLRLGQLPSWLRPEEQGHWTDGDVNVTVTYQSQMFRNYKGPSFNSFSIESQFPYLENTGEHLIYLNDDFFFTSDLQPSDFWTSAYGTVLRLDPGFEIGPAPLNANVSPVGEWGPLGYSSWLLSERFGTRAVPYPVHAAKAISMPILDEVAHIWETELSTTAGHKFRGMTPAEGGSGDAYMTFLLTHFVIERWREALLWSWVMGRIGGDQDQWGEEQQHKAWEQLGGDIYDVSNKVVVKLEERRTLQRDRVAETLRDSGQAVSDRTAYAFSSADGYPYGYRREDGRVAWPRFSGEHLGQHICSIDFNECIGSASSASEAFKTIAFEKNSQCGDCIIHALRSSSGVLGLSAFLPQRERIFKPTIPSELYDHYFQSDVRNHREDFTRDDDEDEEDDDDEDDDEDEGDRAVPYLPLVKNWAQGDFTLNGVLAPYGKVNLREWTMRLLERYRFVLGDTNVVFLMVDGPNGAASGIKRVTPDVSLLCMNDDVTHYPKLTDKILRDWQERRFGQPAEWER